MSVGMLLSWMVCGLIVGLIAHLLVRGGQHLGLVFTMVLGRRPMGVTATTAWG